MSTGATAWYSRFPARPAHWILLSRSELSARLHSERAVLHRSLLQSNAHSLWEDLENFYIRPKLPFPTGFQFFHLLCYASSEFPVLSSWQRWCVFQELLSLKLMWAPFPPLRSFRECLLSLGQLCNYLGLSCGFEHEPEQRNSGRGNPYPRGIGIYTGGKCFQKLPSPLTAITSAT